MLKGYQRKLIMIRTNDSDMFESAFFILRSAVCEKGNRAEMVSEANRILQESNGIKKKKSFKARHLFLMLGIGFLLGSAALGAVWFGVS